MRATVQKVSVSLTGPWPIKVNEKVIESKALTCFDPVMNLVELVRIESKNMSTVTTKFADTWLA